MEQNREDILIGDINKQVALGFSEEEIRQNLHLNGYMQEEISKALKLVRQSPAAVIEQGKKSSPWSLLISLFFIVRGIIYFSKGQKYDGIPDDRCRIYRVYLEGRKYAAPLKKWVNLSANPFCISITAVLIRS